MMIKTIISSFLIKRGFRKLVKEIKLINEVKMNAVETVEFLFSKKGELIRPWQFKEEILQLAIEVEKQKPNVIVEIGTANGGTFFMATRIASDNALIISIDLPGGPFGGGYPSWKKSVYKTFKRKNQKVELIRGNSHLEETYQKLVSILGSSYIDYLFIDGDHTYEGAKKDFELYRELVKPGGLIGFHDIVIHKDSACDVSILWNEIKNQYDYKEFVVDWEQNCFGVGLIKLKNI